MKKLLSVVLVFVLVSCLASCQSGKESSKAVSTKPASSKVSSGESSKVESSSITVAKSQNELSEEEGKKEYRYEADPAYPEGLRLLEYIGDSKDVVVPDSIGGKLVGNIYNGCYKGKGINSIKLSKQIKYYGEECFAQNNITKFEVAPYANCNKGAFAENKCTGDDAFVVDPTHDKTTIRGYAGSDATVVIPDWAKHISIEGIACNSKIEKIVFPASLQVIPDRCVDLKTLPNLKEIVNDTKFSYTWSTVFNDMDSDNVDDSVTGQYKNVKITTSNKD